MTLPRLIVLLLLAKTLTLIGAEISVSPSNQFVRRGNNAEFRATTSVGEEGQYRWRFNGVDLLNATNSALTLTNVQRFQEGFYSLSATFPSGESLNATGQLTVCWQVELTSFETNAVSKKGFTDAEGNLFTTVANADGFTFAERNAGGLLLWKIDVPAPKDLTILSWGVAYATNGAAVLRLGDNVNATVIVAISSDGEVQWQRRYDGGTESEMHPGSSAITIDGEGNIYLAGDFSARSAFVKMVTNDFSFSKLNSSGDVVWVSVPRYGQTGADPRLLATDEKGNIVASRAERVQPFNFVANVLTTEFDSGGIEIWQAREPISSFAGQPYSLLIGSAGDRFVSMVYWYDLELGTTGTKTIEYSPEGRRRAVLPHYKWGRSNPVVGLDTQENFYVCEYSTPTALAGSPTTTTLTFSKFDSDGNHLLTSVEAIPKEALPLPFAWTARLVDLRVGIGGDVEVEGQYYTDQTNSVIFVARFTQNITPGLPVIHVTPASRARPVGEAVPLSAYVTGDEPLTLKWMFNGEVVAGATNSMLLLENAQTNQSGIYNLLATNAAGCAFSEDIVLKIIPTTPVVIRPVGQPFTVVTSSSTNTFFEIDLMGGDPGRSYWVESSTNLVNWQQASWHSSSPIEGGRRYRMNLEKGNLFYRTAVNLW